MPNPTTAQKSKITAIQAKSAETKPKPLPPLPNSLPKEYRTEWRALVQHMRDGEIWVPQKAGLIEAYLMNLKAIREAEAYMQEHGAIMDNGKPNPASMVLVRHTATLNKLAEQLALGKGKVAALNKPSQTETPKGSQWTA